MSVIANLYLKDQSTCIGLNLVGVPSGQKTTILSLFYSLCDKGLCYKTDSFTPKSFVSHAANISNKHLESVDLLPRIKNKCMIVPELAPIFGKRAEDLIENTATLIRIFDGEGYESDSGVKGKRGYRGDFFFVWLGATVPPKHKVWKTMSQLGARWFFINVPRISEDTETLVKLVNGAYDYSEKIKLCRPYFIAFFTKLTQNLGLRKVKWDTSKDDPEAVRKIINLAKLLAKLRGVVQTWRTDDGELLHQPPQIEMPMRASHLLLQIARGRALINGRVNISLEDVPLIRQIALSSCQPDRSSLINLMATTEDGVVDSELVSTSFNCSTRHAQTMMKIFSILKIGTYETYQVENQGIGRPRMTLRLKEDILHTVKSTSKNNIGTKKDVVQNKLKSTANSAEENPTEVFK